MRTKNTGYASIQLKVEDASVFSFHTFPIKCAPRALCWLKKSTKHLIDVQSGWYLIKKHDTGEQRNYYFGDGKEVDGMKTEDELQLKRRSE